MMLRYLYSIRHCFIWFICFCCHRCLSLFSLALLFLFLIQLFDGFLQHIGPEVALKVWQLSGTCQVILLRISQNVLQITNM